MANNQLESGLQLFRRARVKIPARRNLLGLISQLLKDDNLEDTAQSITIEIVADSTTDKNSLILDFIARTILPSKINSCWKTEELIFINTTFQINTMPIIKVMDRYLKERTINSQERQRIIEESLKRLTILNCFNAGEFIVTLYSLEGKLKNRPDVATLVLDDITAFYWIRNPELETVTLSMHNHSLKNLQIIREVINGFNLLFVFGRTENNRTMRLKPLTEYVDYHIAIGRVINSRFVASIRNFRSATVHEVPFTVDQFKVFFD